jgi:choline dehydrogenase-like flavoprotein
MFNLRPRGKGLGGSSMLNAMLYVRGSPHDYDEWESFGNPGWKFEDVLPFFKKSEHFHRFVRRVFRMCLHQGSQTQIYRRATLQRKNASRAAAYCKKKTFEGHNLQKKP